MPFCYHATALIELYFPASALGSQWATGLKYRGFKAAVVGKKHHTALHAVSLDDVGANAVFVEALMFDTLSARMCQRPHFV